MPGQEYRNLDQSQMMVEMVEIRPLSEALAEVARLELNEDPRQIEECLGNLKDWIQKQSHLKARTDDQWLVGFLRGCKWSLERSKEKLDIYYSLRTWAPDLFSLKHTDPRVMKILDKGVGLYLPKLASPTAPRVLLIRPGSYDPEQFLMIEVMSVVAKLHQICYMEDDNLMVSGAITIMDLQGTKLSHFIGVTPLQIKKIITINQEAAPTRMKAVHFINMPPFFETFFNIAKSFLNEKNRKRMYVHKNYTDLYKYVSKEILPIEYEGHDCSIQEIIGKWKLKYQQYHGWFEDDLQYGTDETKRSEKSKAGSMNESFGVQGSFKKLEFD